VCALRACYERRMTAYDALSCERFPRAARYHPEWLVASVSGGAHALWLTEWLASALDLHAGMRVLDLGCGRAASSIFLHRELGVEVWAADLWFSADENQQRVRDAGIERGVIPIHADARALPFAAESFDAIISIDAYMYFGTDDLYLPYVARFLKPNGALAIALSGLTAEIDGEVPEHLREYWTPDLWCLHSAAWWRRHWERTGILAVETADAMPDGWMRSLDWQRAIAPDNSIEIRALEADQGRHLTYVRAIGRRLDVKLEAPIVSIAPSYTKAPLLRG
jgi:cyclopropane fatty-acyl-phospholipid synthase-like methyltransferase